MKEPTTNNNLENGGAKKEKNYERGEHIGRDAKKLPPQKRQVKTKRA